ncbi:hypothetical protein JB92DRAFT_2982476 [Gautieria morchelliformis]|nr:hypothetical protein JB92DRAFT_2982476 [Gautieria morchelliformis]
MLCTGMIGKEGSHSRIDEKERRERGKDNIYIAHIKRSQPRKKEIDRNIETLLSYNKIAGNRKQIRIINPNAGKRIRRAKEKKIRED